MDVQQLVVPVQQMVRNFEIFQPSVGDAHIITDTTWYGQTYTWEAEPSEDLPADCFLLYYTVRLWRRVGSPGTLTLEVWNTLAGVPTGAVLASGTTDGDTVPLVGAGTEDRDIWLTTPITRSGSTLYAVSIRSQNTAQLVWMYNSLGAAQDYNAIRGRVGTGVQTLNSGVLWTTCDPEDHWFLEYGYPR